MNEYTTAFEITRGMWANALCWVAGGIAVLITGIVSNKIDPSPAGDVPRAVPSG